MNLQDLSLQDLDAVSAAAIPALVALALFAVADLERFVLVVVMAALILPQAIISPGGAQIALADLLIIAAVAAWLIASAAGAAPKPHVRGNAFLLPALLFVGYNAVSLAWSVAPSNTVEFTIQTTEIVVLGPLLFASLPRTAKAIHQGMWVFIGCTTALALFTLATYSPDGEGALAGGGIFGGLNKNVVGSYLAAGLIMAACLWMTATSLWSRRVLGILALIELAGMVSTISRGSIIGGLVAVSIVSLLLKRKRALVVLVAIFTAVGYLAVIGPGSGADKDQAGSYDSSEVRKYSYQNAIDQIQDRPFLGTGGGTYIGVLPELDDFIVPDPNNMFLLTWAELGIGGFCLLLFVLFRFLRLLLAVRHLSAEYAGPGVAAGGVTLSLLIHFQFDVTWTRGTTTLAFCMIGLMVACLRLALTNPPARSGPTLAPIAPVVEPRAPLPVA